MIDLTKSPTATALAQAVVQAIGEQARQGHLDQAEAEGLELAYRMPPQMGQSAEWYLAIQESKEAGRAILFGDEGQDLMMGWAKFRLVATAV